MPQTKNDYLLCAGILAGVAATRGGPMATTCIKVAQELQQQLRTGSCENPVMLLVLDEDDRKVIEDLVHARMSGTQRHSHSNKAGEVLADVCRDFLKLIQPKMNV